LKETSVIFGLVQLHQHWR